MSNVYVLNPAVARLFRQQKIPGVVISDELAAVCDRQSASPDKGRAFFYELAARQIAIYRGLGYRGAFLGGVHTHEDFERVLAIPAADPRRSREEPGVCRTPGRKDRRWL